MSSAKTKPTQPTRQDKKAGLYQAVTDRIIEELQAGRIPWKKPWKRLLRGGREYPANYGTYLKEQTAPGTAPNSPYYSGINAMILSCFHYARPYYMTFKQAQAAGGQVKKGSKGTGLIYFEMVTAKQTDQPHPVTADKGPACDKAPVVAYPMIKPFYVFHISDIEGIEFVLPELAPPVVTSEKQQDQAGQRIYEQMPNRPALDEQTYTDKAAYRKRTDTVFMPPLAAFDSVAGYYATLFHELVHSTMHESRLNRTVELNAERLKFDDPAYAKEELLAEIGSAYLLAEADLDTQAVTRNQAAYLQHWLGVFEHNPMLIGEVAPLSRRTVGYILAAAPETVSAEFRKIEASQPVAN